MNVEAPPRHALIRVDPDGWAAELAARPEHAAEPTLAVWARRGWPLVARRRCAGDRPGRVSLGLPLPPALGKRRIAVDLSPATIISVDPALSLRLARLAAPAAWAPTVDALLRLADRCRVEARVFGSFAWAALTGLGYVAAGSDLDLLWPLTDGVDELLAGLAAVEANAPGRLDGEMVDAAGAAVNWRELASGGSELLAKTSEGVSLVAADAFRRRVPVPA